MTAPVVTVYTKPACPQCHATKQHLDKIGVKYTEESIDDQVRAIAADLGMTSAPIVSVIIDGVERNWSGYRPGRLEELRGVA